MKVLTVDFWLSAFVFKKITLFTFEINFLGGQRNSILMIMPSFTLWNSSVFRLIRACQKVKASF